MMWTDDPAADAETYYQEQDMENQKQTIKERTCPVCGKINMSEYYYDLRGVGDYNHVCLNCAMNFLNDNFRVTYEVTP